MFRSKRLLLYSLVEDGVVCTVGVKTYWWSPLHYSVGRGCLSMCVVHEVVRVNRQLAWGLLD